MYKSLFEMFDWKLEMENKEGQPKINRNDLGMRPHFIFNWNYSEDTDMQIYILCIHRDKTAEDCAEREEKCGQSFAYWIL